MNGRWQRSCVAALGRPARSALVLGAVLSALGCAAELPPRLPSTAIHDRTASRVALVDFVVADPERARKVKALYVEIERLMLEAQHTEARELGSLGHGCHCAEEEVRASVAASRTAELAALERYIGMELAIRSLTTPEEFAALDRIK